MTNAETPIKSEEHANDPFSEARRRRRDVEIRRVAAIRSAGSHFKLVPTRASRDATGR